MPPNIWLGAPATEQPAAEGSLLPDAEQTWQHAVISMFARPRTRRLPRFLSSQEWIEEVKNET